VATTKEIEIKILEIDRGSLEERLVSLGAKKVFDDEIHALYYDFPDNAIRHKGCTLRLRREGAKAVFTLKKDLEGTEAKIREEHELEVSDFDGMRHLLETLGMKTWLDVKKHRTSYELKGVHFEIDAYHDALSYIPQFLEIEAHDVETIYAHAELLGYKKSDCKPWDILQVAAYYSSR
jgi:adenylate cyclase, class 2